MATLLGTELACVGIGFGHEELRAEREWRALCHLDQNDEKNRLLFKAVGGRLTPHVEMDFRAGTNREALALPIRQVVSGPALDFDLTKESTRLLLNKYGTHGFFEIVPCQMSVGA